MVRGIRIAAFGLLALEVCQRLGAQSLGETAEKERKRREAAHSQKAKTYTDRDLNPEAAWTGWRDWSPADDGHFVVQMPARPSATRDSLSIGGDWGSVSRVTYRATDPINGIDYAVSVAEYPADYVRKWSSYIWADFQSRDHLDYGTNAYIVGGHSTLSGHDAMYYSGNCVQLMGSLIRNRFYQLMARTREGNCSLRDRMDPFFGSFRPLD